jgi:hypothetical protein
MSVPRFAFWYEIRVSQTLRWATLRQKSTIGHRCVATIDTAEWAVGLHANGVTRVVGLTPHRVSGPDRRSRYYETNHHAHLFHLACAIIDVNVLIVEPQYGVESALDSLVT